MFAFLFLQVESVLFPVPDVVQVYLLAPRKWCSDLKGVDGFTRFPAPYNIRVKKRQ